MNENKRRKTQTQNQIYVYLNPVLFMQGPVWKDTRIVGALFENVQIGSTNQNKHSQLLTYTHRTHPILNVEGWLPLNSHEPA